MLSLFHIAMPPAPVLFAQLLIGLINGSFYAMLSLGLAIIFGLLNIINFTHGAQYMMGAFLCLVPAERARHRLLAVAGDRAARGRRVRHDLGEQQVKNIARPIRVFQLRLHADADELDDKADAPPPEPPQADEVEIAFWDSITHSTSALEYQVYLERYPDGAFAPLARARLDGMAGGQAPLAVPAPVGGIDPKAIELTFWESVKDSDNADMFHAYLEKYPSGEFALLADAKLAEIATG